MEIRITLCGELIVEVDGARRDLRGRHGRMLFAYLVLNRDRAIPRSELVHALWLDAPPTDAPASLRVHLSRLRAALGAATLEGRGEIRLKLPPDAVVDVELATASLARAESAAAAADWHACARDAAAAGRLVEGSLIPGLEADWIASASAAVEETHLRSLELLATAALALAPPDLSTALAAARRLISRAPFRESGRRLVLRALLVRGEFAEGLREYESLRTLLRDELGIVPSSELRALHARLLDASAPTAPATGTGWRLGRRLSPSGPIIGRTPQLATLAASAEAGGLTVIGGEPGVGKTRLMGAAAAELRSRGWAVLYGRCEPDAALPYQALVQAFDGVVEALGEEVATRLALAAGASIAPLLPGVALRDDRPASTPGAEVWRLYRAAERFVGRLAADAPVLIVIDDLHCADRATLGLVRHLAAAATWPIAMFATYRSTEVAGGPLLELADREDAEGRVMHLEGLGREELAATLVRHDLVLPSPALLDDVHQVTGGNPLYAVQLARHLIESGTDRRAWSEEPGVDLPAAVRGVVMRRVSRLPPPAQDTLAVAAVIGREVDLDLLERVTRRGRTELLEDLEAAVHAGILRQDRADGQTCAFGHALVRHALLDAQLPARREDVHRRVADELEAREPWRGDPDRLAHHWTLAGDRSDPERVVAHSRRAGERAAARLAFEQAATSYGVALDAGAQTLAPLERTELLLALSRAERLAGSLDTARASARQAAVGARHARDPSRLARAALSHAAARTSLAVDAFEMQHARESSALLTEAHAALDSSEGLLTVRVLSELASQRLAFTASERRQFAVQAVAAAARLGDVRGELLGSLARTASSLSGPDDLVETIQAGERAASLAAELDDTSAEWAARRSLSGLHFVRGDIAAMDHQMRRMQALVASHGDATQELGLAVLQAGRARFEGRSQEAQRIRGETIAAAPDPATAAAAFGAHGWMPAWEAGHYAEIIADVEAVLAVAPQALPLHGLLALLHCEAGEPARARARFERLATNGFAFERDEFFLIGLTQTALACSYLDDRDRAPVLHAMLVPYSGLNGAIGEQCVTNGPVDLCVAALEVTLGRSEAAEESLARAEQLARAWGDPLAVALATAHRGRLLTMRGERAEGERLATQATDAAGALGTRRVRRIVDLLADCWQPTPSPA